MLATSGRLATPHLVRCYVSNVTVSPSVAEARHVSPETRHPNTAAELAALDAANRELARERYSASKRGGAADHILTGEVLADRLALHADGISAKGAAAVQSVLDDTIDDCG